MAMMSRNMSGNSVQGELHAVTRFRHLWQMLSETWLPMDLITGACSAGAGPQPAAVSSGEPGPALALEWRRFVEVEWRILQAGARELAKSL